MAQNKTLNPIGVLVIALLPAFIISSSYSDPFILPKNFWYAYSVVAILGVFGLTGFFRKYQTRYTFTWLDAGVLLYFISECIRLLFTQNKGFTEDGLGMLFWAVVCYFVVKPYFLISDKNSNSFQLLTLGIILVLLAQAVYGFLQYGGKLPAFQKEFSIGGSYGNPSPYANLLVLLIPFSLSVLFFHSGKNKTMQWVAVISLAAAIAVLPFTKARTAWIAASFSVILIPVLRYNLHINLIARLKNSWVKFTALLVLLIFVSSMAYYLFHFKEESASGRLFIWKVTGQMIADKPVFGHGFESFPTAHNDYQAEYFKKNPNSTNEVLLADAVNYGFNEYLQITSESGLVGLAIFLNIIVLLFVKTKEKWWVISKDTFYYTIASLFFIGTFLIISLFSYPLRSIPNFLFLLLVIAYISANFSKELYSFPIKENFRKLASLSLIVVLGFYLNRQMNRQSAAKKWLTAFQLVRQGKTEEAKALYEKIYPTLSYYEYFTFNYGAELSVMGDFQKSIQLLNETKKRLNDSDVYIYLGNSYEGTGQIAEAITCFKQAAAIMPIKFYPQYRLVKIYQNTGNQLEAKALAKKILSMPVKVSSDIITGIRSEMQQLVDESAN